MKFIVADLAQSKPSLYAHALALTVLEPVYQPHSSISSTTKPSLAKQDQIIPKPTGQRLATLQDTVIVIPKTLNKENLIVTKTQAISPQVVATVRPLITEVVKGITSTLVAEISYTSTNQVAARPESESVIEEQTPELTMTVNLATEPQCPTTSNAFFDLIPIEGPPSDHPDIHHGDLNLTLRAYTPTQAPLDLIFYYGHTDPDPPQLSGLFQPNRAVPLQSGYQVNQWIWDGAQCGGNDWGCPGGPITDWEVTLAGLPTIPGEAITIPERETEIYGGGYKALVLFAAEQQITLGYTRQDTVAAGYTIHLEGMCVDPNLLALYRAQHDTNGWRSSGSLPALRNDQILGTALGSEIRVAIRDNGAFMDPRSVKDWWR